MSRRTQSETAACVAADEDLDEIPVIHPPKDLSDTMAKLESIPLFEPRTRTTGLHQGTRFHVNPDTQSFIDPNNSNTYMLYRIRGAE